MTEDNFRLFKKHMGYEMIDECHIMACGTIRQLEDNVLSERYIPISFSFDYLKRAEMYFKSIHGDLFNEDKLRIMVPKTDKAPIVFIYSSRDQEQIFVIAPRCNVDDLFHINTLHNSKKVIGLDIPSDILPSQKNTKVSE